MFPVSETRQIRQQVNVLPIFPAVGLRPGHMSFTHNRRTGISRNCRSQFLFSALKPWSDGLWQLKIFDGLTTLVSSPLRENTGQLLLSESIKSYLKQTLNLNLVPRAFSLAWGPPSQGKGPGNEVA